VKSSTTDEFWDLLRALSPDLRKQAQHAYVQFTGDPFHPGLNFEEVDKRRHLWSVRVTRGYRVLGIREGDEILWFWIGTHREYEKLIKGR
jgi:hypothetical protein